jgi:hypothetical protein
MEINFDFISSITISVIIVISVILSIISVEYTIKNQDISGSFGLLAPDIWSRKYLGIWWIWRIILSLLIVLPIIYIKRPELGLIPLFIISWQGLQAIRAAMKVFNKKR